MANYLPNPGGPLSGSIPGALSGVRIYAQLKPDEAALARQDENVAWFRADRVGTLAFDHNQIVEYALWRLRNKLEYGTVAYAFLGSTFTLAQVREVYEAVLGRALDPANFRRQLQSSVHIEPTDEYLQGGRHRPPRLYRYTGPDPREISFPSPRREATEH